MRFAESLDDFRYVFSGLSEDVSISIDDRRFHGTCLGFCRGCECSVFVFANHSVKQHSSNRQHSTDSRCSADCQPQRQCPDDHVHSELRISVRLRSIHRAKFSTCQRVSDSAFLVAQSPAFQSQYKQNSGVPPSHQDRWHSQHVR